MLPWMATGAVPVRIRTATHFSLENSHRETSHRGRTFRSPWAFVASSLNLKLVCRKYPKNNEFRTKKFPNPEFLYGISSFCTLSENNSFLHGKISHFCIFLVKNRILNTEFSAMRHTIHKIVSKRRCQSYFQNFFFLPSFGSLLSPSPLSVVFFTAFRESPVSASNCFSSSFASGFSLSGVCTTSVT